MKDSSVPQTSKDILNMKSRFSKQSEDQIKKEQEDILKNMQRHIQRQKMAEKRSIVEHRSGNGGTTHDKQSTNDDKSKSHFSSATVHVNSHVEGT
jgi:hypothetical protein